MSAIDVEAVERPSDLRGVSHLKKGRVKERGIEGKKRGGERNRREE